MTCMTETYDQVAGEDLEDLSLQAGATSKDFLEDADEQVAQRRTDEHAVQGHLGHPSAEVMPMFADIVRNPRSQDFLEAGKKTGCQHLRAQRIRLQLTQVELCHVQTPGQPSFRAVLFLVDQQQVEHTAR